MATTFRSLRIGTVARQLVPQSPGGDRRTVAIDFSPSQQGAGNVFLGPDRSVTTDTGAQIPFGNISVLTLDAEAELWAIAASGAQLVAVIITEPADLSASVLRRVIQPMIAQLIANQQRIIALLEAQLRAAGAKVVPAGGARGFAPRGRALIAPED